jgi:hypothetical protein
VRLPEWSGGRTNDFSVAQALKPRSSEPKGREPLLGGENSKKVGCKKPPQGRLVI